MGRRATWVAGAGAALLCCAAIVAAALLSSASVQHKGDPPAEREASTVGPAVPADPPHPGDPKVTVSVSDHAVGSPIASGFLGFSFEFQGVRAYTGSDPAHVNPVLVQLIRNLTPGQAPVLRIGGNSTDISYVAGAGVKPLPYQGYELTPSWMATTGALAKALGARMIMGLNLAANDPALDAAELRDYVAALPENAIEAVEIGNEPNVYNKITVYRTAAGDVFHARPRSFGYPEFRGQFQRIAHRTLPFRLAAPALAAGPSPGKGSWVNTVADLLRRTPRISTMTVHRYPLRNCYVPPSSPQYPTVSHLLSSYATVTLAHSLKRWIDIAHAQHRRLRVDELNSVACRGKAGVSDTFASALWVTDALFSLARAGVDGIDMHTLPDAAYELFAFSRHDARWQAQVRPVYYGLQLFAQAAPAGARMLAVSRRGDDGGLSVWATRGGADGHDRLRVVVINKSQAKRRTVSLRLPAGSGATATVERMLAPSAHAKRGVTLGGRSYGATTATGELGAPGVARVRVTGGRVTLSMPRASAALVTVG
ncbi:MAG TPA: glycosyl hydrolase family 79 C-terminal domain-containing protein [Solirubrobacteraceae bacterium]|nr:glycosyl hydrolase family 79 C-terminal domain-containing protein [Solirubrobacteraceae bacterium]